MTDTIEPMVAQLDQQQIAQDLVDRARSEGVSLVGPGGLLTGLTKTVLETALEVEMSDHLGYDKHEPEGRNGGNCTRSKTVLTEVGPVEIEVPRDRDGTFDPVLVRKRQRRLDGLVLSLTARGLTTGEVSAHFAEAYGMSVSKDTVSKITDKVIEEMHEWQHRPLDRVPEPDPLTTMASYTVTRTDPLHRRPWPPTAPITSRRWQATRGGARG